MYIYFDIGANNGSDSIYIAKNIKNSIVYAFEPTLELVNYIKEITKDLNNYIITPKAVSNYTGFSDFKISGNGDWGCSSLCDFNTNLDKTWPGRKDFNVTNIIKIPVIKLKDFIIENNISHIDYLHVDVQGHDLEVLQGLEDK